jgi:hypothetical protein
MEVTRVLNLVDQNIERLDKLFKVCSVLCITINDTLLEGQKQEICKIQ